MAQTARGQRERGRERMDSEANDELTQRVAKRVGLANLSEVQFWFKQYLRDSLAGRINGDLTVESWEAFRAAPGDEYVTTAVSGRRIWNKTISVKGTPSVQIRLTYFEGMDDGAASEIGEP